MKVTYRNSDTTTIEIETSEEIAVTLTESYRKEDNLARKCRYHHYSYDAIDFEGEEYADPDTPESILTDSEAEAESNARYAQALALLTEVQRSRFLMYAAGLSTHEIARREGTNQKSVHESIEAARKKLKKFYADTPLKLTSQSPYCAKGSKSPAERRSANDPDDPEAPRPHQCVR